VAAAGYWLIKLGTAIKVKLESFERFCHVIARIEQDF
jgi:hypothetical protein